MRVRTVCQSLNVKRRTVQAALCAGALLSPLTSLADTPTTTTTIARSESALQTKSIVVSTDQGSTQYWGGSAEDWNLLFAAIQAIAVVLGVPYAAYELRALRFARSKESLEKMLEEWRADAGPRDRILTQFPSFGSGSAPERAGRLLNWVYEIQAVPAILAPEDLQKRAELLRDARRAVEQVNDLGTFVEIGAVDEKHFFGQFHSSIIRIVFLLEPYILLRTTLRGGDRWGMRLRRIRVGAETYHLTSPLHRRTTIRIRDEVVLDPTTTRRHRAMIGGRLVPSKNGFRFSDELQITATRQVLETTCRDWQVSWSDIDRWFDSV